MRYIDGDDTPAMAGLGFLADVHEGVDGNLYEWVEGLSAWGEPIGFWQGLAEVPVDTGMSGLGALYQASDGNLYQMHGLEEEKDDDGDEDDDDGKEGTMGPKMGPGKRGEINVGPEWQAVSMGARCGARRQAQRLLAAPAIRALRRPGAEPLHLARVERHRAGVPGSDATTATARPAGRRRSRSSRSCCPSPSSPRPSFPASVPPCVPASRSPTSC